MPSLSVCLFVCLFVSNFVCRIRFCSGGGFSRNIVISNVRVWLSGAILRFFSLAEQLLFGYRTCLKVKQLVLTLKQLNLVVPLNPKMDRGSTGSELTTANVGKNQQA